MTAAPILAADAFEAPARIIAFPLMAACAIIFAIGISIYGF